MAILIGLFLGLIVVLTSIVLTGIIWILVYISQKIIEYFGG
jgi:hypothetical protein